MSGGGVRFFYKVNDQESTTWVTFKNEFFTEISSLKPQKPSRFNIEAVENTELVVIDKKDMDLSAEKRYLEFMNNPELIQKTRTQRCRKKSILTMN